MTFSNSCGPCHGYGYIGSDSRKTCGICQGTGVITFEGPREDYLRCGPCQGSGFYGANSEDTCAVCNGFGLVDLSTTTVHRQSKDSAFWDLVHPTIIGISRSRFEAGHYADSVEAALKEVNSIVKARVKELAGIELDGTDLMYRAFSPKSPLIRLDDLDTASGVSVQQGYMQLFAGSIMGIRNPKAHGNIVIDRTRAIHFLFLASLLIHKLEEAERRFSRGKTAS